MDAPFQIESLEVVGYATSLSEAMVPTLVTPVFRIREKPETIVFPPFVIHQGLVRDGTAGTAEELGQFVSKGDITLLPQPCPAQAVYELWVDDSITAHYEPMDDVDRKLGEIAERSMKDAVHALKQGWLKEADKFAGVALCADDRRVEPIAARAAICLEQGKNTAVEVMARMAAEHCDRESFNAIVQRYTAMITSPDSVRRPIQNVAAVNPHEMLKQFFAFGMMTRTTVRAKG